MSARERLQDMVRTERGDMNVYSQHEVRGALDGYRAEVLNEPAAELERLRIFARATEQRHKAIRDRFAQVNITDSPEAWDLGMAVLAILDSPPHPDSTP